MQAALFLLHKNLVRAQELLQHLFLGLETFLLSDHFDPKVLLRCVKPVLPRLVKNCNHWISAVYSSGLKKPRAIEPSGLKKTMRHKISGLAVIKPVDNQITLNPSAA